MRKPLMLAGAVFVVVAGVAGAQGAKTYTGVVSDSMCKSNHASMKPSSDPNCVVQCVRKHGSKYVLMVGETAYTLSDQQAPERFAARKVRVSGSVDPKTNVLAVTSIEAAQ